jgi:hypothetical protein
MTLPKSASSKRTNLPRASDYSKSFRKDWERLAHSGRFDLKRLKELMIFLIANDGSLQLLAKHRLIRLVREGREIRPEAIAKTVSEDLVSGTYETTPISKVAAG